MNINKWFIKWSIIAASAASLAATGLILALPAVSSSGPSAVSQVSALGPSGTVGAIAVGKVPSTVTDLMPNLPGPSAGQGSPIASSVHRLMSGLGGGGADLYAYPTTSGSVCIVASEPVPVGTCVERFDRKAMPIAVDIFVEVGGPPTLVGVVPDDTVSVDVIVNGEAQPATLATNGVFYQAKPGTASSAITAVVAHFQDGSSSSQKFVLLDS